MKRFKQVLHYIFSPVALLWVYPVLLVIPNIALDITEQTTLLSKLANLFLPWGIYLIFMSIWKNVGRSALILFSILFYGAFQVVLLYLYGESVIAVDMFLNLVTTNVSEATELLGNLAGAIVMVCLIYMPALVWAVMLVCRRRFASVGFMRRGRIAGMSIAILGMIFCALCRFTQPGYSAIHEIFPVNVINNTIIAAARTAQTDDYFRTSAGFSYGASSTRPADSREVYVMVVGETSRADNWQLFGYRRHTTPRLCARDGVVGFPNTLSESNTTHKSVPLMLSYLSADNFGDSIVYTKGIISAFNEAGFNTAYFSNQGRNHSFIDFFAREAQTTVFLTDSSHYHHDMDLVPHLRDFIARSPARKLFVILHTYGSHFNYTDRYPAALAPFGPVGSTDANPDNRPSLINAYDNTIAYTDCMLDSVIATLDSLGCPAALMYASDHGEDIFDDARGRFLHASPVPTYWQIHVPMLLWMSQTLRRAYPALYANAVAHSGMPAVSSEAMFHTMLQLAGVASRYLLPSRSLVDTSYVELPRRYLNDHNEGVALDSAGLRRPDCIMLSRMPQPQAASKK